MKMRWIYDEDGTGTWECEWYHYQHNRAGWLMWNHVNHYQESNRIPSTIYEEGVVVSRLQDLPIILGAVENTDGG